MSLHPAPPTPSWSQGSEAPVSAAQRPAAPWWSPTRWPAGWPLMAALVGYPLWWALGLGALVFPIVAIPMAWQLKQRAHIEVPPWFGLWLLFVGWSMLGAIVLGVNAPDTLPTTFAQGLDAYVLRTLQYLGATVVLLYVGNLSEHEVPKLRIVRWLGVLFIVTLVGGYVGLALPNLAWKSPVELVLGLAFGAVPRGILTMVHPQVAQIQDVIGTGDPRPNAPFEFTNAWGNNLSILIIWFIVGWIVYGTAKRRLWGLAALGIGRRTHRVLPQPGALARVGACRLLRGGSPRHRRPPVADRRAHGCGSSWALGARRHPTRLCGDEPRRRREQQPGTQLTGGGIDPRRAQLTFDRLREHSRDRW